MKQLKNEAVDFEGRNEKCLQRDQDDVNHDYALISNLRI